MANTQAFCNSAKTDLMEANIALADTGQTRGAVTKDVFKAALYEDSATITKATTVYTATGEVTGTNYVAGGGSDGTITNATAPALDGDTAHWTPSASIVYSNVTLSTTFDAVLIYNDSHATKYALSVHTFGGQTVTAGDFTLTMPTNDGTTGLFRIA
jgi:hypothetical protein